MVLYKGHNRRGIGVQIIVTKVVVHPIQPIPPVIGLFVFGFVNAVEESKIHHRFKVTVNVRQLRVFLPSCGVGWFCNPCLAHCVEVGVLFVKSVHPLCHRFAVGIRVSVHPNAVDAHRFNPPDAVLNKVTHHVGVALVKVGIFRNEPSINRFVHVHFRSVGVEYRC